MIPIQSLPLFPNRGTGPAGPAPQGWPVLRLGFRPFYLGAALLAMVAIPLWVALYLGQVSLVLPVAPLWWHAHEMLFGFAVAVIVGFLLTAGKAWTGLATPRGPALALLAALWLAARIAAVTGPYALYAVLDLALLPLVAGVLLRLLLQAGNRRNLPLAGLLALLALANLMFHLSVPGWLGVSPLGALHAGLALVVLIECVMGGRVIPAFTMSATPGLQLHTPAWLERSVLVVTPLALALWVFAPPGPLGTGVLGLAALLHLARQWHWKPWVTGRRPILWILHAAYAWIAPGLALLAMAQAGLVAGSVGVHALAVGATGGLIIGMVTRTARGHTGRPLQVSRTEVLAYTLVMGAAVVRVVLTWMGPPWQAAGLALAAGAWALAFGAYLWVFAPWLARTRLDGKDG